MEPETLEIIVESLKKLSIGTISALVGATGVYVLIRTERYFENKGNYFGKKKDYFPRDL